MTTSSVWMLGGYQTDFARNLHREGLDFADLTAEAVTQTCAAAGVPASEIGVVHIGNAFGQLFTGQGHLGAMPATVCPDLWGVPATRHEAACASGGTAVLAAMADLRAGNYDVALVLGVELEKTVSGDQAAAYLGAAAWVGHEGQDATYMWPYMFAEMAEEYDRRYGIDDKHLRRIAEVNFGNARLNPNAQTRDWTNLVFEADDTANPIVEGRLRRTDCSQITDGAAGVILVSDRYRREHPDVTPWTEITGWGHASAGLSLTSKFEASRDDEYVLPHLRQTITDALGRARVDLDDLDGVEVHDCFSMSEYLVIDHLGLTAPGQSWEAIETGTIERDGRLPINPSGGLIGGGHPVGASGVRMLLDAASQVSGRAGDLQVDGATTFGTVNFGGSTATCVALVCTTVDD
ncbi:acetyl-CoA acetyltransferase [Gordonia phthalatica]|uniref:Acetyl-CoA acetyltransferase n=1 Tax=Gordonia phthalatica TaxID=1136941 RepID=A0A0N9NGD7_9ACTN|nr:acetyl-CoA acetyltransferase [Gordonia phthalatica]ALG86180.1 acetyl-CoA acetyltransferase [Gordonia phthalatica]